MLLEINTLDLTEGEATATIAFLNTLFPGSASSAIGEFIIGSSAIEGVSTMALSAALDAVDDPETAFSQPAPLDPATAFATAPLDDASSSVATASPVGAPSPSASVGAPAGVDLDPDGIPWDARIHAGTKAKNADGRWKAKKGLGAGIKDTVTAELKAIMVATPGQPAPVPTPPATTIPTPPATPLPPAAVAEAQAVALADPTGFTEGQSPPAMFAAAMKKVTEAQKADKVTVVDLQTIITGLGVAQMRDLLHRPDLIPLFEEQLAAYVASAPA